MIGVPTRMDDVGEIEGKYLYQAEHDDGGGSQFLYILRNHIV